MRFLKGSFLVLTVVFVVGCATPQRQAEKPGDFRTQLLQVLASGDQRWESRTVILDGAERRMEEYLLAAKKRVENQREDNLGATLSAKDLADEQQAWTRYREQRRANVYAWWADGTVRNDATVLSDVEAICARTHEVWKAYLTCADGTPPLLPEP